MSIKSSISLTEQQDAFARSLVDSGQFSSLSSVLQQGLELLRQKNELESLEARALRELLEQRLHGQTVPAADMERRTETMIERKRRGLRVDT
ncbi:ribbon-helix-helix domain-containing protein [Roseibium marinum]|uniref:Antitoxin ParD1/3/4 n=1 Tax=Roseibium marinum TaxID=281252 RepID=A0A2S3V482_9HYPH|nr:type II toxin-antitoxin system ParD family antitoxin [Roseibium marinum]POF34700.1 antitoxin ParD1/3/4 [Roseibium marinum]